MREKDTYLHKKAANKPANLDKWQCSEITTNAPVGACGCVDPARHQQGCGRGNRGSGGGNEGNRKAIGGRTCIDHRRRRGKLDGYSSLTHAGAASARQIFLSRLCTATTTRGHAQFKLQIGQCRGTRINGGVNLAFRDGITYANVHENNYRVLFDQRQANKNRDKISPKSLKRREKSAVCSPPAHRPTCRAIATRPGRLATGLCARVRLAQTRRCDTQRLAVFRHCATRDDNSLVGQPFRDLTVGQRPGTVLVRDHLPDDRLHRRR